MKFSYIVKTFTIFFVFFISACSCYNWSENDTAANLQSDAAHMSLLNKKIQGCGVEIISTNDAMVLILPAKRFFNPSSATIANDAYYCLDNIVELLRYYEIAVVRVNGFADYRDQSSFGKSLAVARAQKVSEYLWDYKVHASLVYAEGSSAMLIRRCRCVLTDYVVISFSKLPKYPSLFDKLYVRD